MTPVRILEAGVDETFVFSFARPEDEAEIRRLLKNCGLPEDDIGPHVRNFLVARLGNEIVGSAGLEFYDEVVLLRSLAVVKSQRCKGLGNSLTEEILKYAEHLEASEVYLLTMTAVPFFAKHGFAQLPREEAPASIRNSHEFTWLCPDTAVLMRRRCGR